MSNNRNSLGSHDQVSEYELLPRTTSPPPPPSPRIQTDKILESWTSLVLNTWLWEVLAMLFSFACLAAIVCILMIYSNNPRPNYSYGFTLNALISILATAASRGPLGSLLLVIQHKGQSLVSLGALITILTLMFDPFVQQILTYPTRQTVEDPASSKAIADQAFYFFPDDIGPDFTATVNTGVWSHDLNPNVTCSSGNCMWDTFESEGMCSQCEDITSVTTLQCDPFSINNTIQTRDNMEIKDPDNANCSLITPYTRHYGPVLMKIGLQAQDDEVYLRLKPPSHVVWKTFWFTAKEEILRPGYTDTYAGLKNPQFVLAHADIGLASNETTGLAPLSDLAKTFRLNKVTQCALAFCTRTYDISVSNGTALYNESISKWGEWFPRPSSAGNESHPVCWKPTRSPSYNISSLTRISEGWVNTSEFVFCPDLDFDLLEAAFEGYRLNEYIARNLSAWEVGNPDSDLYIYGSPCVTRIISDGLEAVVRDVALSFTRAAFTASSYTVSGAAYAYEVYVSVNWIWLLLPAMLVALGILFLLLTIAINRQQKLDLWKSSVLAVLFHGLGDWGGSVADRKTETADQMEKTADTVRVRLKMVDDHRGLMLE
ncbi:hypothetical protein BDW74DRAFT_170176 [Aspergillus multicolor]|uniref:DUF3176 domain-containing protein n=1 Tax=Aspergillus multicolor TaxID=41759 RepID=UPI003CCDE885